MSCPDCFRGAIHTHAEPTGTIETLHGLKTYVAGGSDSSRSKSTIIYLPDAFSLKLVNNKILADKYASVTGCRVLIPDVIPNGGLDTSVLAGFEYVSETSLSVWNFLPKAWTVVTLLPHIIPFMYGGHPKYQHVKILEYARAVRKELPAGGKLGVCGFCWGAYPATKLCAEGSTPDSTTERLIDAQFNGHPSYIFQEPTIIPDSIKTFKTPYAIAVAEKDMQFNAEVADKTEATLREKLGIKGTGEEGYVYEFRRYKGATHGFCVKAREADMENYHGAVTQATEWFGKYLN